MPFKDGEKGLVIGLYLAGKTTTEIMTNPSVHATRRTINRWIAKYEENGQDINALHTEPRTGRPKITSGLEDNLIVASCRADPLRPAMSVVAEVFPEYHGVKQTIYNRLHGAGIHCRTPANKTELTPENMVARLNFAYENLNQQMSYWNNTVWSDEKSYRSDKNGSVRVWRPDGSRYHQEHILTKKSSGHITANFWGCMTSGGPLALADVDGRFDCVEYCATLDDTLITHTDAAFGPGVPFAFMHDNAPWHTANLTKEWFNQHPHIELRQHPPYSPDLNPMEHVWAITAREWEKGNEKTKAELRAHVWSVWRKLQQNPQRLYEFVLSMPRRLQAVIDAQGGPTKY